MRVRGWRSVPPSLAAVLVVGCGLQDGGGPEPELRPPEMRALEADPPVLGPLPAGPEAAAPTPEEPGPPAAEQGLPPGWLAPLPAGTGGGAGSRDPNVAGPSAATPTPAPADEPTPDPSGTPTLEPTPTPDDEPEPTPTPDDEPTPTPTPTPISTPTPTPTPSPEPDDASYTTLPEVPPAAPAAVRGLVRLNGRPPGGPVRLSLVRTPGWQEQPLVTDASGAFSADELPPGDYMVHYYNDTQRDRVGYWRSRSLPVTGERGAAFPAVDLGQRGMLNQPSMDARVTWPVTFRWEPPAHRPEGYRFRVHSQGGRSFELLYQSGRLPPAPRTFIWDGAGASPPLQPDRRYFWGLVWDLGPAGEAGNLYQAVQLVGP
ncbi:MAG: hypothetical protein VKS61_00480 [Candidatus Sericytochromatia bacterium]|nr:hypothetical protein [Candidatus Sericytochromatia bacterium]